MKSRIGLSWGPHEVGIWTMWGPGVCNVLGTCQVLAPFRTVTEGVSAQFLWKPLFQGFRIVARALGMADGCKHSKHSRPRRCWSRAGSFLLHSSENSIEAQRWKLKTVYSPLQSFPLLASCMSTVATLELQACATCNNSFFDPSHEQHRTRLYRALTSL